MKFDDQRIVVHHVASKHCFGTDILTVCLSIQGTGENLMGTCKVQIRSDSSYQKEKKIGSLSLQLRSCSISLSPAPCIARAFLGCYFQNYVEVEKAVRQFLALQDTWVLSKWGFFKLTAHYNKCLTACGDYVGK